MRERQIDAMKKGRDILQRKIDLLEYGLSKCKSTPYDRLSEEARFAIEELEGTKAAFEKELDDLEEKIYVEEYFLSGDFPKEEKKMSFIVVPHDRKR